MRRDPGNRAIQQGKIAHKTIKYGLFCTEFNASWAADNALKSAAYPLATISFPANRKLWKYEAGDPFILYYSPYNIAGKIYRVMRIEEENIESEQITVHAVEDIHYLASIGTGGTSKSATGIGAKRSMLIEALTAVMAMEAPYVLIGTENTILVVAAGKENGKELGFLTLLSSDGESYNQLGAVKVFAIHGRLNGSYPKNTYDIDDYVGFEVEFDNDDVSQIETISRADALGGRNLTMLGYELITFQTITPVSGNIYKIENVVRGRWDTEKQAHDAGTDFFFLGIARFGTFEDASLLPGATRYVKLNPYNLKYSGDASEAEAIMLAVEGRARKPYPPINFMANGSAFHGVYTDDIVLTWDSRLRTEGAGVGDPGTVVDAAATWEGYFEIEVWVGGELVRTATAIDSLTWTYTEAMSLADNGSLPTQVLFKIKNYRASGGVTYSSAKVLVKAYNPGGVDHGTATTTTTTTSTTSTTSSSSTTTSSSSSTTTSSSSTSTTTTV
jgi:hypothetical protein